MSHPPVWVFLLLAALVVLGLRQARPVEMSRGRVLVVPLLMAALSVNALMRLFGPSLPALVAWAAGLMLPVLLRRRLPGRPRAAFSTSRQAFQVEGSWGPLALMLVVFALRFAAAVGVHVEPALAASAAFATALAFGFGLASGAFVARALLILGTAYGPRKVLVA